MAPRTNICWPLLPLRSPAYESSPTTCTANWKGRAWSRGSSCTSAEGAVSSTCNQPESTAAAAAVAAITTAGRLLQQTATQAIQQLAGWQPCLPGAAALQPAAVPSSNREASALMPTNPSDCAHLREDAAQLLAVAVACSRIGKCSGSDCCVRLAACVLPSRFRDAAWLRTEQQCPHCNCSCCVRIVASTSARMCGPAAPAPCTNSSPRRERYMARAWCSAPSLRSFRDSWLDSAAVR